MAAPFGTEVMLQLRGGATGARSGTIVAASSSATTICWGQALRSEWASPSEMIIDAVATNSIPVGATLSTAVAAPVDEKEDWKGEEGEEQEVLEGAGARRQAGTEVEGGDSPPPRRVSFSQHGRNVPRFPQAAGEALAKVEVLKRRDEAEKQERGCTVPTTRTEAKPVAGGGGGPMETEVVRWGRMDLLSVLYPPLVVGEGMYSRVKNLLFFLSS